MRSVIDIVRNPALNETDRITGICPTLVLGFITLPVYRFSIAPRAHAIGSPRAA